VTIGTGGSRARSTLPPVAAGQENCRDSPGREVTAMQSYEIVLLLLVLFLS